MSIEPKPLYFKNLDTLRFISFFLVFWQHSFYLSFANLSLTPFLNTLVVYLTFFTGGWGVHIFFVISGFLITFLMLKEEEERGGVNVKNFYLRRIFRIWPLYYIVLLSGIFILPHLFKEFYFSGNLFNNLTFLNNFNMHDESDNVGIAWSVAVEEQFYLFWPLAFILLGDKKLIVLYCLIVFGYSVFFNLTDNSPQYYFHTFSNLNYLMSGCLGAIFYFKYAKTQFLAHLIKPLFFYCAILIAIVLPVSEGFYVISHALNFLILPVIYLYLVIYLVHKQDDRPVSVFSLMGKYTYGMYLYHPTVIILTRALFELLRWEYNGPIPNLIFSIVALAFSIGISIASYKYFEKYFLKLKRKFSSVETRI
jgi:peptidoglycan/LPS O-acetylase OafA/YrhL